MAYIVYRHMYPHAWVQASHELNWQLGGLNTMVLIVSSLTMALGVRAAMLGNRKHQLLMIATTAILGEVHPDAAVDVEDEDGDGPASR